ncbi:MAG: hypothetical protein II359_00500 [Clostridia bacterium]|nr:hypothetical protein [Clostridia bacterium]
MTSFLFSLLLNLIFHAELLVLAVLAWLAHLYLGLPGAIAWVLLGLWVLIALLITLGLGVLSRGTPPPPYQKNVNPYSKKTKDYTQQDKKNP